MGILQWFNRCFACGKRKKTFNLFAQITPHNPRLLNWSEQFFVYFSQISILFYLALYIADKSWYSCINLKWAKAFTGIMKWAKALTDLWTVLSNNRWRLFLSFYLNLLPVSTILLTSECIHIHFILIKIRTELFP
jgi:hypothetical protein